MSSAGLNDFAARYTAAWCSQDAASVAACFAETGVLQINDGAPAVGRTAITVAAQEFMTTFPDMIVVMDRLREVGDIIEWHWTMTGTNSGPGGTGKAVRFSGYEALGLDADGLIREALGHFDEAEYQRQLQHGVSGD